MSTSKPRNVVMTNSQTNVKPRKKGKKIFLSVCGEDIKYSEPIKSLLSQFVPEDNMFYYKDVKTGTTGGDDWLEQVDEQFKNYDIYFIFLCTSKYLKNTNCIYELKKAIDYCGKKRIIPIFSKSVTQDKMIKLLQDYNKSVSDKGNKEVLDITKCEHLVHNNLKNEEIIVHFPQMIKNVNKFLEKAPLSNLNGKITESILESYINDFISNLNNNISYNQKNKGDFSFGSYRQNSSRKENIEWFVLEIKEDKALLISKNILDCQSTSGVNDDNPVRDWDKSHILEWLNSEFANNAFTHEQKSNIIPINLKNNSPISSNSTLNSSHKVFLLSEDEVADYSKKNNNWLRCVVTTYAKDRLKNGGIVHCKMDGTCSHSSCYNFPCCKKKDDCFSEIQWWWLRSSGFSYRFYQTVSIDDNEINHIGKMVCHPNGGIRPAIWISAELLKKH